MGTRETDIITAPAYWASYLINGDASGISIDEMEAADRYFEGWDVLDVVRDNITGEALEPRFTWYYALHGGIDAQGGDVLDYVVTKR